MVSTETNWRFLRKYSLSSDEAALLLLFVVLFLPAFLSLDFGDNPIASSLIALVWRIVFYESGAVLFEATLGAIAILPYIFLKYLFVIQFFRYYSFRTSKKRVMILGLLSEVQMFIMLDLAKIIFVVFGIVNLSSVGLTIPLPFSLVTCLLLLFFVPRSDTTWIDEEKERLWWMNGYMASGVRSISRYNSMS